jgi:hypothetical protein
MARIYFEDKRTERAQLGTKVQHALAGVPLLWSGIQNFREGWEVPIALLEIGIAVVVLAAFIKEVRAVVRPHSHSSHTSHSAVGWFDLAAGVLLIFEAFHSPHHKAAYLRPQFLAGVASLGLGLFHGRLHASHKSKCYLELNDSGLHCRLNRFRRFFIPRQHLASIDVELTRAVFHRTDGKRHTLPLSRLHNSEAVREELVNYRRSLSPS